MDIKEKISKEARKFMVTEIENSSGNEVFFRGIPDESGMIVEAKVLARGNKTSAPAIIKGMKKGEVIIHNHPSGFLYPSDADIGVSSAYANKKEGGSYIVNNNLTDIYVIVELFNEKEKEIDITPYFSKEGMLSQIFKGFEYRKEQLVMAQTIEKGVNSNTPVVVEAGTGTGKTLAYLIPTIEWAIKNEKKIIISTNTINLQEQLLSKDIPVVKKVIGKDFKYILVKGRGNYLCNRKYFNLKMRNSEQLDLSDSQKGDLKRVLKWAETTETGDKSELLFEVDRNVWELLYSESDMCAGNKCPYKNECFFLKSREEKQGADVLITNHHLYFADLAIRKEIGFDTDYSILPEYDLVVFDEAHNIEHVARDYFSYQASEYAFKRAMGKIYNKSKNKGGLPIVADYLKKSPMINNQAIISQTVEEIKEMHRELLEKGNQYFGHLKDIMNQGKAGVFTLRIKKAQMKEHPFFAGVSNYKDPFIKSYLKYVKETRKFIKKLEDVKDDAGLIGDLDRYLNKLDVFFENFKFIDKFDDEDFIYWIESKVKGKVSNVKLVATPLTIDKELQENLYAHLQNIVFTSATIAIEENFDYFKNSIGLDENTIDKVIHSPFDYDNQMTVYVPMDMLNPSDRNFNDDVVEFLRAKIVATEGKTFILFTSYQALNYVYYSLRDTLEKNGLDIFVQGTLPRTHLLDMFKKSNNPVLFGTDSFWEGVDIKGEKLSNVIIIKLPFKVPTDPVTEAIIENITKQNKNSFMEYQIPEAVIKFKQGIGRLIRSKKDKGTITILDNRVITKRYGSYFMNSIPTKNIKVLTKSQILRDILNK